MATFDKATHGDRWTPVEECACFMCARWLEVTVAAKRLERASMCDAVGRMDTDATSGIFVLGHAGQIIG